MKTRLYHYIIGLMLLAGFSVGEAKERPQERTYVISLDKGLEVLKCTTLADITVHQSTRNEAVVTYKDTRDHSGDVVYKKGVLKISHLPSDSWSRVDQSYADVDIYCMDLRTILLQGIGNIEIDKLATSDLNISCSGQYSMDMGVLNVGDLDIRVSGMGSVEINRVIAENFNFSVSGSGDISVGEVKAGSISGECPGMGDIELNKIDAERLKMSITGMGDFKASGRVAVATCTITGLGDIDIDDLKTDRLNYIGPH